MEVALTNNEEILMNLLSIISILPICKDIIDLKDEIERKDTLNYHVERWVTISSLYFRSFELSDGIDKTRIYLSYTIDSKYYVSEPDKNLDYFHETGVSYQVRDLLLSILDMKEWEKHHWKDIRDHDDRLYDILAKHIMTKTKDKYNKYLRYTPKTYSLDKSD